MTDLEVQEAGTCGEKGGEEVPVGEGGGRHLAEFLHNYVANKEKMELLRWLKTVESFVEK
jgi:hypothetical protein